MAQNEGRKEGRKVLSRRFVNKKVTFPTGGGYSPFIFRLISIQDGKKFGAPLLRRSSSKLEEGVHGDCAASPRHHPFHYAEINLGSLFSYQSRITPKPHHRYVPSHRSSLYPSRRGKAEECRVELSLEGNGVKGGERGGGCRRLETLVWKNDGHIGRCAVVNQFPLGNSAERNINSRGWTLWIQIAPSDAR